VVAVLYRVLVGRVSWRWGRGVPRIWRSSLFRHQVAVLNRQAGRVPLTEEVSVAAGRGRSRAVERSPSGWLVTPDTLLRSHRRLATPTMPKSEGEGNLPPTNQGATAQVAVATKSKRTSLSAVVTQRVVQLVSATFALESTM
jgi:hypothetical protein